MKYQKGFTLVELIFAIFAIFGVVIPCIVIYVVFHFIAKFW